MLKPQLLSTCNTFLPDIGNNGNVMVLMKDFYHGPLNGVQIVIVKHKPFRFLGIALPFSSRQAFFFFFFQDDKDVLILDISPEIFEKRPKRKKSVGIK